MRKVLLVKILVGALIAGGLILSLATQAARQRHRRNEAVVQEQTIERESKQRREDFQARTAEMVRRHGAVVDWKGALPADLSVTDLVERSDKGLPILRSGVVYGIEVQRAMARADRRPLLLYGWVEDVVQDGEQVAVYFRSKDIRGAMRLVLALGKNLALERLIRGPRREGDNDLYSILSGVEVRFAFVVEVESVRRTNAANYAFTGTGRLLDFTFLGEGSELRTADGQR